ncbi:LPS export ABC transporter periplasmic protein LptC [Vreelandella rituensis]|uniref:LPS export ABC transporter periplasmic protein LptC n=1 Tax=Vreelandella rituensis TaxID=2282306 RepID=UPI0015F0E311|nr:LPS export ABC transporter periplasmic protein LptC [Halomonas rituensis]
MSRQALLPRWLWIAGMVALLGGLLVYLDPRAPQEVAVDPAAQAEEPNHVLEGADMTLFGADGLIQQSIRTPHLVHIPQDSLTQVEMPRARLYDEQRREWLASADNGTVDIATHRLSLSGSARLIAPESGWQLDSEVLHYDSRQAHAWSDAPVLLQQPPQHMRALRMDTWLNDSQVRLTGDVQGYHPAATHEQEETP